ncbi:hypothetical protein SCUCBS95973_003953 [Sporothrix curviconia]|uniref:Allantoate permease n=1 Tax=Sporothrix curviconia TaxID=1260050 RepID=A0ABP0BJM5_9PEZI
MSLAVEPPEIATAEDVVDVHPRTSTASADRKESSSSPTPKEAGVFTSGADGSSSDDGESFALQKNPFADPEVAEYWRGVYENATYECRHVFDPSFTWSEEEERKLVRKLDWRVCLWACVMFFGLQVDHYNYGNTVFLVSFLLAELPSQLVSKKIGPDRWIPIQMVLWSVVAISQTALNGRTSFLVTRALLGVLEGGFIPDIVLWLSYFYTSRELPVRLSYFWTALSGTTIITSLLAFAIFHLDGVHGRSGWRWLFLIEGLITLSVGIASFFLMPASAVQTKAWYRPNGWFTDREISIVVNRVLRDDPSKGDMHNRQAVTPRRLWEALKDYDLWPLYIIGLLAYIPQSPPTTYITLILKSAGFSTFNVNLLAIPASVFHIIMLILLTRLSDLVKERSFVSMLQNAILVGWTSKNANNVGARSVSAALYNITVQMGGIISAYIYRADDAPYYHRGNKYLIIINFLSIAVFLSTKAYYIFRNKQREKQWNALSHEEQIKYKRETTLQGSRRLDFRFAH